jgi:hypothetical protein
MISFMAGVRFKYFCARVIPVVMIAVAILAGDISAQGSIELQKGWRVLADSLAQPGIFARPQICPEDSSYIAYELHTDSAVKLFLYNARTGTSRQIIPTIPLIPSADSTADSSAMPPVSCGQLAWNPVAVDGEFWAAYVARIGDRSDIYLYEARRARSRLLWRSVETADGIVNAWGDPQWSPDGLCLAFTVVTGADSDIRELCDLGNRLKGSPDDISSQDFHSLVTGSGRQFDPVWCPVAGSGLVAYTEQDGIDGRFHIKIYDIYRNRSYGMIAEDTARDYFGPSWGMGGRRLAYLYHRNIFRLLNDSLDPGMAQCVFGAASVDLLGDSVLMRPILIDTIRADRISVVPNSDVFSGMEWLPGGRNLIITTENERGQYRIRTISFPEMFPRENRTDFGERGFGGKRLPYPRDIDVQNRNIAFVFNRPTDSRLLIGTLEPNLAFVSSIDGLTINPARQIWWDSYARQVEARESFASRVWNFLWSPIGGQDIGINRPIVPIAGGIVALAVIAGGNGGGRATQQGRDWTPPDFPAKLNRPGIHIRVGL